MRVAARSHHLCIPLQRKRPSRKRKTVTDYVAKELLVQVIKDGKLVYDLPSLEEIRAYHREQMDTLWDEVKRFTNPHQYYVDLSQRLWDLRDSLVRSNGLR